MLTLARTVPGDAGEAPRARRSTVRVFRRFLDTAKSCEDPGGDPCGVPIGVAAVRVMSGACGHDDASAAGLGPCRDDGKTTGTVDGCGGKWKDSGSV